MTEEGKVKTRINKVLEEAKRRGGIWWFMPVPSGYGKRTLDYIGWDRGRPFAIEAKRPGKHPTAFQDNTIRNMQAAGGVTFVIADTDEYPIQPLVDWLTSEVT